MKVILENMKTGEVLTCDAPAPELRPGGILIETHYSAISAGTERAKVETAEKSLLGKAMARPDLARQVIDYARANGVRAAYQKVQAKLESLAPLGYSCAGVVLAVGDGVTGFLPGDRVACGGAGAAHSELNFVMPNLAVRVPPSVSLAAASLTTIGSIAMQGLRQSEAKLGETVAVIGAGLVGILAVQLARAAGCRVIAVDRDAARAAAATSFGAHLGIAADDPSLAARVAEFSRYGADVVLVCAAARSSEPLELAARIARDRGRIVIVGDVGMGVSRANMYNKELSLLMSRSYGPGRYDPQYEDLGADYPVGYVRWTEGRNMEAFVDLLATGAINVDRLIEQRRPVESGADAYQALRSSGAYTCILEYPAALRATTTTAAPPSPVTPPVREAGVVRAGCIGAGSFAASVLFPALRSAANAKLAAVATSGGATAESARRTFGFAKAATVTELLSDAGIDAVFIASRHSSHAAHVASALASDKAVFVEKPLAITPAELAGIEAIYERKVADGRRPFVMVGYNRRFAPATQRLRSFFAGRQEPMMIHVRVNAGYIPREHWTQQASEGGRIIGEFCHFMDWARFLAGSPIRSVSAAALPNGARYSGDNLSVTVAFLDGSIANIIYVANGDKAVGKESFEVFCEGSIGRIDDFDTVELVRGGKVSRTKGGRDKGHRAEIAATLAAMAAGAEAPIPFAELVEVARATFAVLESCSLGAVTPVAAEPAMAAVR